MSAFENPFKPLVFPRLPRKTRYFTLTHSVVRTAESGPSRVCSPASDPQGLEGPQPHMETESVQEAGNPLRYFCPLCQAA